MIERICQVQSTKEYAMETSQANRHPAEASRDRLAIDLKQVVASAEELLAAAANQSGELIAAARANAESTLRRAKTDLSELEHSALDRAKHAVDDGADRIKAHPWSAVGVGAGIGLLLGMLIARR
jgi:ElaB/YqjD/DUF883 family membrane-anchored ribosome-binding protein